MEIGCSKIQLVCKTKSINIDQVKIDQNKSRPDSQFVEPGATH